MKASELRKIIQEELKSALNEATPQEQKIDRIVNGIAKEFGYSADEAVFFMMSTMKKLGYITDFKI